MVWNCVDPSTQASSVAPQPTGLFLQGFYYHVCLAECTLYPLYRYNTGHMWIFVYPGTWMTFWVTRGKYRWTSAQKLNMYKQRWKVGILRIGIFTWDTSFQAMLPSERILPVSNETSHARRLRLCRQIQLLLGNKRLLEMILWLKSHLCSWDGYTLVS